MAPLPPTLNPSPRLGSLHLFDQPSASLKRSGSTSSHRSGLVPSPRPSHASLNDPQSGESSASGSRHGSFISTPRLLSRRNSAREQGPSGILRKISLKEHSTDEDLRIRAQAQEAQVIETPHARMDRDPGSGRKMINQYVVLHELGHGTHGRVRLGQEVFPEADDTEYGDASGPLYAIKIVDRNPKRKRLTGFSRQRASNPGKLVNESEIRKEIAIFKKVNHPNVVRMKEIIDDPENSKLFMILEYCEQGEIKWKDSEGKPALAVAEIRRIFRQTLLGLEYLHHQGIIHRDIKPSNLLLSNDGTVKISDFGCSHYSEALRVASAQPEGDEYVDDIELAKTAGSPAFFAPEMCYSGVESDPNPLRSISPRPSPVQEIPAFTLRPPSVVEDLNDSKGNRSDAGRTIPLRPTSSNDSARSRPHSSRSASASTLPQRERLPITNAIDVWALGVTLYCLLFGKTPFDAPNEYLLMQVIPTAEIEIPATMGHDQLPTNSQEGQECLDLLQRLLEKDPSKRITLDQAKRHAFTLRDLPDPTGWLLSTDPHAQTFVTVSNDEVAQVVIVKAKFMDRVKHTLKSTLQLLNPGSRNRSRSIGASDASQPSVLPNSPARPAPRDARDHSPLRNNSPVMPGLARRLSLLGTGSLSPRRQSPASGSQHPALLAVVPLADEEPTRPLASSSSLDKLANASPPAALRRRQSSDIDVLGRQRSPSNASSTRIGSKLVRLLSRNSSQRTPARRNQDQPPSPRRMSLDEVRNPRPSTDTFESGSPEVGVPGNHWGNHLRSEPAPRRGSNLSEEYRGVLEEVDWNETLSDDDDYDPVPMLRPSGSDWQQPTSSSPSSSQRFALDAERQPARGGPEHRLDSPIEDDGLAISVGSRRGRKGSMRS